MTLEERVAALEAEVAALKRRKRRKKSIGFVADAVGGELSQMAYQQDPDDDGPDSRPPEECKR